MNEALLFNCCTGGREPDWTQFARLELGGCCTHVRTDERDLAPLAAETWTEGGLPAARAQFFTIYGRRHEGDTEAITDVTDPRLALTVAGELMLRSGLPVTIAASLASTR